MVLYFLILTHFLLYFDYDVRMEKEVLAASLLNALYKRVVHQLFNSLTPSTIPLREYLAHHL